MHYLIYKITNKLNNKIYVGKHKTEDKGDGYFGSGLLLARAMEKHGAENFTKEILFECKSLEEMNRREADIVDEEFIARDDTYNIMLGGSGGFDYINANDLKDKSTYFKQGHTFHENGRKATHERLKQDEEFRKEFGKKISNFQKLHCSIHGGWFTGKSHSKETRKKQSDAKKGLYAGKKNPNYGNHWITNGVENKLVKKEDVPSGWRKGRV